MSNRRGKFSHMYYDDLSDTLFIYFKQATVQCMTAPFDDEREFEELAVWLEPSEYERMKEYMNLKDLQGLA